MPGAAIGAEGDAGGAPNPGFRLAPECSADAGVGVPRSPGRYAMTGDGPGATLGAVASRGTDAVCEAGSGTMFPRTGLRPTSVAPATAVIAPGTLMCEYLAGAPLDRSATLTA